MATKNYNDLVKKLSRGSISDESAISGLKTKYGSDVTGLAKELGFTGTLNDTEKIKKFYGLAEPIKTEPRSGSDKLTQLQEAKSDTQSQINKGKAIIGERAAFDIKDQQRTEQKGFERDVTARQDPIINLGELGGVNKSLESLSQDEAQQKRQIDTQKAINKEETGFVSDKAASLQAGLEDYTTKLKDYRRSTGVNLPTDRFDTKLGINTGYTDSKGIFRATEQDLSAIKNLYKEAIELENAPEGDDRKVAAVFRGLKDSNILKNVATLGMGEIVDNFSIASAFDKVEKGEATEEEAALVDTYKMFADMQSGKDTSRAYGLGDMMGEMADFLAMYAMTGGAGNAAKKGITKSVGNLVKRRALQTALRTGRGAARAEAGVLGTKLLANVGKSLTQATLAQPITLQAASERANPQRDGYKEDGTPIFVRGEKLSETYMDEYWNTFSEFFPEALGQGAASMLRGGFGRVLGAKAIADPKLTTRLLTKLSKGANNVLGIQSFPIEVGEEILTGVMQGNLNELLDEEQFTNMLMSIGIIGGVSNMGNAGQRLSANRRFKSSKSGVDNMVNTEFSNAVNSILELSEEGDNPLKTINEAAQLTGATEQELKIATIHTVNNARVNQMSIMRDLQVQSNIKEAKNQTGGVTRAEIGGEVYFLKNTEDIGTGTKIIQGTGTDGKPKFFSQVDIAQAIKDGNVNEYTPEQLKQKAKANEELEEEAAESLESAESQASQNGIIVGEVAKTPNGNITVESINPDGTISGVDKSGNPITASINQSEGYKNDIQKAAEKNTRKAHETNVQEFVETEQNKSFAQIVKDGSKEPTIKQINETISDIDNIIVDLVEVKGKSETSTEVEELIAQKAVQVDRLASINTTTISDMEAQIKGTAVDNIEEIKEAEEVKEDVKEDEISAISTPQAIDETSPVSSQMSQLTERVGEEEALRIAVEQVSDLEAEYNEIVSSKPKGLEAKAVRMEEMARVNNQIAEWKGVLPVQAESATLTEEQPISEQKDSEIEEKVEDVDEKVEDKAPLNAESLFLEFQQEKENVPEARLEEWQRELLAEKIKRTSFIENDDKANITQSLGKSWFSKEGKPIDQIAQELSGIAGRELTLSEITEFVKEYPSKSPRKTTDRMGEIRKEYKELTGKSINKHETTNGDAHAPLNDVEQSQYEGEITRLMESGRTREQAESDVLLRTGEQAQATQEDTQSISDAIESASNEIGIPVTLVDDITELPQAVQNQMKRRGLDMNSTKGVFHNGTIYMNPTLAENAKDARETYIHEVVGHYGVRSLLTNDKIVKDEELLLTLNQVYDGMTEAERKVYTDKGLTNPIEIADEHIADTSMKENKPTWYNKAISELRRFLNNYFDINFSEKDVENLIQRSRASIGGEVEGGETRFRTDELKAKVKEFANAYGRVYDESAVNSFYNKARESDRGTNLEQSALGILNTLEWKTPIPYNGTKVEEKKESKKKTGFTYKESDSGSWIIYNNKGKNIGSRKTEASAKDIVDVLNKGEQPRFRTSSTAGASKGELADAAKEWKEKGTDSKYFQKWFKDSKVVDGEGKPMVVYHGTFNNFDKFQTGGMSGLIFVTENPEFANSFIDGTYGSTPEYMDGLGLQGSIMPLYVKVDKPWDYNNKGHITELIDYIEALPEDEIRVEDKIEKQTDAVNEGDWETIEIYSDVIQEMGYDGVYIKEDNVRNLAVFSPNQIKSATGNQGTFDPASDDIRFRVDKEYSEAVESGDIEKAQTMVDETAKTLGFTHEAYHGGPEVINVFDENYAGNTTGNNDFGVFYFSDSKEVADDYSKESINRRFDGRDSEELQDGYGLSKEDADFISESEENLQEYSSDEANQVVVSAYLKFDNPLVIDAEYSDIWNLPNGVSVTEMIGFITGKGESTPDSVLDNVEYDQDEVDNYKDEINERAIDNHGLESIDEAEDWMIDEARDEVLDENGIYPEYPTYDGIIIENVLDDIGDGSKEYQSVMIAIDPNKIKSSDPITYDNNGNIIPLSERFSASDDIRFRVAESPQELEDFVKDSEVKETVYHGTPEGGFTEFDESKKGTRTKHDPEDVGYHFTNDKEYASAYSLEYRKEAYPILMKSLGYIPDHMKVSDKAMTYNVRLNMTNPMSLSHAMIDKKTIAEAKEKGYDSIIGKVGENTKEFVVFSNDQILIEPKEDQDIQFRTSDNPLDELQALNYDFYKNPFNTEGAAEAKQKVNSAIESLDVPRDTKDAMKFMISKVSQPKAVRRAIDKVVEKYEGIRKKKLTDFYGGRYDTKIKATKNVKGATRSEGRYNYENTKFFEEVRRINNLTKTQAEEELAAFDEQLSEQLTTEDAKGIKDVNAFNDEIGFEDRLKYLLTSVKAAGATASIPLLKKLNENLDYAIKTAEGAKSDQDFQKLINRSNDVNRMLDAVKDSDVGGKGRDALNLALKYGGSLNTFLHQLSPEIQQEFNLILEEDKKQIADHFSVKKLYEDVIGAEGVKELAGIDPDVKFDDSKVTDKQYNKAVNKMNSLLVKMSEKKFDAVPLSDKRVTPKKVSILQILDMYNAMKNENVEQSWIRRYGQEQIDGLMAELGEDADTYKNIADAMMKQYKDYYDVVNPTYVDFFNKDMPKVTNYYPSTAEVKRPVDAFMQRFNAQAKDPKFTKQRDQDRNPLMTNSWSKVLKYIMDANWYTNVAQKHDRIKRAITDPDLKHEIEAKYGQKFYDGLETAVDNSGLGQMRDKMDLADSGFGKLLSNWAVAKIGANPGVFGKQLISMINFKEDMPFGEWEKGFAKNMLHPKETIDFMMENPSLKARWAQGGSEAMQVALGAGATMPKAALLGSNFKKTLTYPTRIGDLTAIIYGGKPYVDYLMKKKGMSKGEAFKKFNEQYLGTQQSNVPSLKGNFQNVNNVLNKSVFMFANTRSQYMRKLWEANTQYQRSDKTKADKVKLSKAYSIFAVQNAVLYTLASELFSSFLYGKDSDEDDKYRNSVAQAVGTFTGGLPFVGDLTTNGLRTLLGGKGYDFDIPVLEDVMNIATGKAKPIDALTTAVELLTGFPAKMTEKVAEGWGLGDLNRGQVVSENKYDTANRRYNAMIKDTKGLGGAESKEKYGDVYSKRGQLGAIKKQIARQRKVLRVAEENDNEALVQKQKERIKNWQDKFIETYKELK